MGCCWSRWLWMGCFFLSTAWAVANVTGSCLKGMEVELFLKQYREAENHAVRCDVHFSPSVSCHLYSQMKSSLKHTGSWSMLCYCLHVKFTAVGSRVLGDLLCFFFCSLPLRLTHGGCREWNTAWWLNTVIFDSLDVIEFDLHWWLSNQTNHLSHGSDWGGGGKQWLCCAHRFV